jgi:NitT/TauT family transport system ATP-binding protein
MTSAHQASAETQGRLDIAALGVTYATSRGPLAALSEIDLTVEPGEFVAVLGPSGCGKSTLLKIVSGLLEPSAGTVTLGGRPVIGPRSDVGMVFQHATLLPWKTVLENVLVPIRAMGRPLPEGREKALSLLSMVGLEKFAKHYPGELSGGMQQRVGIARGLVHDPALLLLDEPFGALDAMTRERMTFELQELWARTERSILFITHSIPEAVFLAKRVIVLSPRPGKVIDVLDIDLPRPRGLDTMGLPAFAAYCNHLRALFGSVMALG